MTRFEDASHRRRRLIHDLNLLSLREAETSLQRQAQSDAEARMVLQGAIQEGSEIVRIRGNDIAVTTYPKICQGCEREGVRPPTISELYQTDEVVAGSIFRHPGLRLIVDHYFIRREVVMALVSRRRRHGPNNAEKRDVSARNVADVVGVLEKAFTSGELCGPQENQSLEIAYRRHCGKKSPWPSRRVWGLAKAEFLNMHPELHRKPGRPRKG